MYTIKRALIFICCFCCCISLYGQRRNMGEVAAKPAKKATQALCLDVSSNSLAFFDYKNYVLAKNHFVSQQYIYWKKERQLTTIRIDSAMIRNIYLSFLKDTAGYSDYLYYSGKGQFKPRVVSTCPFDDSTVLGLLMVYKTAVTMKGKDTSIEYTQIPAVLEFTPHSPAKLYYVDEYLPLAFYYLGNDIYVRNKVLYFSLSTDEDAALKRGQEIKTVARFTKQKSVYRVAGIEPETMQGYLVKNRVFINYNLYFEDNGYMLMSLSDYILNLDTHEKVKLPIADSIFHAIRLRRNLSIDYWVSDFKYNMAEQRFYLFYHLNGAVFTASFKPGAATFDMHEYQWSETSAFIRTVKDAGLSWDGKKMLYLLKDGDNCIQSASFTEMRELEKNYVAPPVDDDF